jgi:phosphatidylglycerol:prolipoprotein diacylglycerol transferase
MHPVLIHAGNFRLTSYVALMALAGVVCLWYFWRLRRGLNLPDDHSFWFLANTIGVSGILGGRLLDMLLAPRMAVGSRGFLSTMLTNQEGFSTFGVLAGVLVGLFYACRRLKMDYFRTLDHVCLVMPVGHGIARIGCFLNGCCFGRPTGGDLPWAVTFTDPAAAVPPDLLGKMLHPTQLYEAAGDAILAGALYLVIRPLIEKQALPSGLVAVIYLAGYGGLRFANELLLGSPQTPVGSWITTGQIFSLVIILLAASFLAVAVSRKRAMSSTPALH